MLRREKKTNVMFAAVVEFSNKFSRTLLAVAAVLVQHCVAMRPKFAAYLGDDMNPSKR